MTDDDALSPAEMLKLAESQQLSIQQQIASFVPRLLTVWGFVWTIGFVALWLIDGVKPDFGIPLSLALTIFIVCLAVGISVSAVGGIRSGRGIRSNSDEAFTGTVYGCTWTVGCIVIVVFAQGLLANGMTQELANIFYPIAYTLFAGIMYIISAAIWRAVPMLILGAWTVLSALAATFFGYPHHFLVLAITGGVGFFALGIASFVYMGRLRRAAQGVAV